MDRPYLTADQLSALDAELGPEQDAFMWIGVVLGLRWAEVAGLVVADVDPLRGMLRVSGQLSPERHEAGHEDQGRGADAFGTGMAG